MKDPIQVLPPSGNLIFVILRVEGLGGRISFTQFDDFFLDLPHSSGLRAQWAKRSGCRFNSRGKLFDCL